MLKPNPNLSIKKVTVDSIGGWGYDYVPTPGEAIVIWVIDTEDYLLKIGDGKSTLRELPTLSKNGEWILPHCKNETCAACGHLCVINRNKIYAVCDETGKVFELWHMDTRTTDACDKFVSKDK